LTLSWIAFGNFQITAPDFKDFSSSILLEEELDLALLLS